MNDNHKLLFKFAQNLGLQDFKCSLEKILIIIDSEGYVIKPNPFFKEKEVKTFWHHRNGHCACNEKYIINPLCI